MRVKYFGFVSVLHSSALALRFFPCSLLYPTGYHMEQTPVYKIRSKSAMSYKNLPTKKSTTSWTETGCGLRDGAECLRCLRFHAGGGVLLDGAFFGSFVDCFVNLGEHRGRIFRILTKNELAYVFHSIFHRLLAARIENTAAFCRALCLLR